MIIEPMTGRRSESEKAEGLGERAVAGIFGKAGERAGLEMRCCCLLLLFRGRGFGIFCFCPRLWFRGTVKRYEPRWLTTRDEKGARSGRG